MTKETLPPGDYNIKEMTLREISQLIHKHWKRVYFGAVPYLDAMYAMKVVDPRGFNFGYDSAESVVLYFLANAQTWRGAVARMVKAELKRRVE